MRALTVATILAGTASAAALPAAASPNDTIAPAGAAAPSRAALFDVYRPGMVIKGEMGRPIGRIERIDRDPGGSVTAVEARVDGRSTRLAPTALTPAFNGREAFLDQSGSA